MEDLEVDPSTGQMKQLNRQLINTHLEIQETEEPQPKDEDLNLNALSKSPEEPNLQQPPVPAQTTTLPDSIDTIFNRLSIQASTTPAIPAPSNILLNPAYAGFLSAMGFDLINRALPQTMSETILLSRMMAQYISMNWQVHNGIIYCSAEHTTHCSQVRGHEVTNPLPPFPPAHHLSFPCWVPSDDEPSTAILKAAWTRDPEAPLWPALNRSVSYRFAHYLEAHLHALAHKSVPQTLHELVELSEFMADGIESIALTVDGYLPVFSMLDHPYYPCWVAEHPSNDFILHHYNRVA